MLPITKMLIKYNYSKRTKGIKYIVIHDTGNTGKGSGVKSHFNYFNGADRNSSADYFVDDHMIGQFVEPHNYSWHCGDGRGKYDIANSNSVGIEICINSDGDYNKAVNNAIELTKHLMKVHNVPSDRVVRHYDASRKSCPNSMKKNDWAKWKEFKKAITSTTVSTPTKEIYRVRKTWSDSASQKGAYSDLTNAKECADNNKGYLVFDSKGVQVYPQVSFKVKVVNTDVLNVRKGASTDYPITTTVNGGDIFTIVEVQDNWGKLKSGAGWISLNYTTRC